MTITIPSFTLPNVHNHSGVVKLRIFYTGCAGTQFLAADLTPVMCGSQGGNWFVEVNCTVVGTNLVVDPIVLYTTDDSNTATVLASGVFVVSGAQSSWLFQGWVITSTLGAAPTFSALWIYNEQVVPYASLNPAYLTAPQTAALIAAAIAGIPPPPTTSGVPVINVTEAPYSADNTGATDATAAISAAVAAAIAGDIKRVYLPKGTYLINPAGGFTGTLIALSGNNIEFFGDGMGQTNIVMPASITLTAFGRTLQISGSNCRVHDITFRGPTTITNNDSWDMISVSGGYLNEVDHNELFNLNSHSGQSAGMPGISVHQIQVAEVNTTLGTVIAAGTRTVTPASMSKIYVGRILVIGGTTETVAVTAITATTFTAVFANAHGASDSVVANYAQQAYVNVHDNYIHDSLACSGIVVNSSGGIYRNNTIIRVGNASTRHGIYVQAGNNLFEGNWAEGIGGYSYHQHLDTQYTDGSQNRYIGNTSVNPLTAHFNADVDTSNGTNPIHPNATPLARQLVVANNTFRSDIGCQGAPLLISMPVLFVGNMLENAAGVSGGAGSVISNNTFLMTDPAATSDHAIQLLGANSIASNNTILNWTASTAIIRADVSGSKIIGNTITCNACRAFAGQAEIANNIVTITGASAAFTDIDGASNIHDNVIAGSGDTIGDIYNTATGVIRNNTVTGTGFRIFSPGGIAKGLVFAGNTISTLANNAFISKAAMGQLLQVQAINITANAFGGSGWGYLVKLNASGELDVAKTTDTRFIGVSLNNYSSGQALTTGALIAGFAPGSEFDGIQTDGTWTVGNVGIISVTSDGKIHDTGLQTPPAYPVSYVVFLDSGVGAGVARVVIMRSF